MVAVLSPMIDRLLGYFARHATPEEILSFSPTEEEIERIETLSQRAQAGILSSEEQVELEQLRYLDRQIMLLKARARQRQEDHD
ncbi:MAG: hypothetical protein MUC99_12785 [Anaerolineae bacterium]|jgi:hypothetical protein|nr:hypothetical protein [Anaerolineae bacterium]